MVFLQWLTRLIVTCCAIFAAWGAWYVVYQDSLTSIEEVKEPKKKLPLAVEVVPARRDLIQEEITLVGSFLPIAQTEVRSVVDGYIRAMPHNIGDYVEASETLCRLDDAKHQELMDQSRARLEVAKAQLAVQVSELDSARRILERETMLDEIGAGTEEALETATANYEIALARKKLEETRLGEVQAEYTGLEVQLRDFILTAPISGYVAARFADVGDLAKPDVPLMQIVDLEKVLTTVRIVEKDFSKIALGQSAVVKVDAYPDEEFTGEVTRIAPTLDELSRTAAVQIEVNNQARQLKPGMFARVSLNSYNAKPVVQIPLAAVLELNEQSFVYLVNEKNEIELREVQTGRTNGAIIAINSGIAADELVVTLGNRLVQPGQKVVAHPVSWEQIELASETSANTEYRNPQASEPGD